MPPSLLQCYQKNERLVLMDAIGQIDLHELGEVFSQVRGGGRCRAANDPPIRVSLFLWLSTGKGSTAESIGCSTGCAEGVIMHLSIGSCDVRLLPKSLKQQWGNCFLQEIGCNLGRL